MIRVVKLNAPSVLITNGLPALRQLCEAFDSAPADYRTGDAKFEFNSDIYAAATVEAALLTAQHKKCAFCESFVLHTGYGDVEHYRPKASYKQKETDKQLKRPGYYWLAYEWRNLFYSCQLCNQSFKRSMFPLKNPRRRAYTRNHELKNEQPLIVDPSIQDPENFVSFKKEVATAVQRCPEGVATIEVLGLNRSELVEARLRCLANLQDLLDWRDALRRLDAGKREEIERVEEKIRSKTEARAEYSAMVRAFLR